MKPHLSDKVTLTLSSSLQRSTTSMMVKTRTGPATRHLDRRSKSEELALRSALRKITMSPVVSRRFKLTSSLRYKKQRKLRRVPNGLMLKVALRSI